MNIKNLIANGASKLNEEWLPNSISPSLLASPCLRAAKLKWRWAKKTELPKDRLLTVNIGKQIEKLVLNFLEQNENVKIIPPSEGEQHKIQGYYEHFKGFIDAIITIDDKTYILEIKACNKAIFNQLQKNGLQKAKPEHYLQLQSYIQFYDKSLQGLYVAVCNDNQDIYSEIINYDSAQEKVLSDIVHIMLSKKIPPKVETYKCNLYGGCPLMEICHEAAYMDVNCRTCKYLEPRQKGNWLCKKHNKRKDFSEQLEGCAQHEFIEFNSE